MVPLLLMHMVEIPFPEDTVAWKWKAQASHNGIHAWASAFFQFAFILELALINLWLCKEQVI